MVHRFWKRACLLVAAGAAVSLPWLLAQDAAGDHGACQHDCRCSRLLYFDRLLPPTSASRSGDALGSVQRTVGLLLADPMTDWSEVRLLRLRRHLADLNEIMMSAEAREEPVEGGLDVTVGGGERTLAALRRVVPGHVRRVDGFRDWDIAVEDVGDALRLAIRTGDADEVEIVRGLGFFGLLAVGIHRPQNDLGVVRGKT